MKKFFTIFIGLLFLLVLVIIIMPAPIDPLPYEPLAPIQLTGVMTPNKKLQDAKMILKGDVNGPEEVAIDSNGRICAGTQDGEILCFDESDQELVLLTNTMGRPLGMKFDAQDNLIVCDAYRGLIRINRQGEVEVLANEYDGVQFKFTDALDISSEGIIYFTDASYKYDQSSYLHDLLEARPNGRFFSYDPSSQKLSLLLKDLYFANGVALSENQDFVLINETYRYRIVRYWLSGNRKGESDIFIDNLPGFPDNISSNGKGKFWLALFTVRNNVIDEIHPISFVKSLISKLPKVFWPKPQPYGLVVSLDEQGNITQSMHDPSGDYYKEVTSANEYNGHLYLGSLHNDRIGKYKLR